MSSTRALPRTIVAPTSTLRPSARRTSPRSASRTMVGVLLSVGLLGFAPASAEPEPQPVPAPAPVGAPISLPATGSLPLPQNFNPTAMNPQFLSAATTYIPALLGAVSQPGVRDTVHTQLILQQLQGILGQASLPPEYRNSINQAADLLREHGMADLPALPTPPDPGTSSPGSPDLPHEVESTPKIQEFMVPTIVMNCIDGTEGASNAVGKALVTAGPQEAPAPGPKEGEAGYVFTALGTGPALADDAHPLSVNWYNLDTGKKGQATLLPNPAINASTGPATYTAVIPTGKGRVLSTVFGTVTIKTGPEEQHACTITPTVGMSRI